MTETFEGKERVEIAVRVAQVPVFYEFDRKFVVGSAETVNVDFVVGTADGQKRSLLSHFQGAGRYLHLQQMVNFARLIIPYFNTAAFIATNHNSVFFTHLKQRNLIIGTIFIGRYTFPRPLIFKTILRPDINGAVFGDCREKMIDGVCSDMGYLLF